MVDACFTDEMPWALYLSKGHPCACVFKGMACILNGSKLPMEWKNFKCTTLAIDCCCLQVLYNQPDFMHVPIILKNTCSAGGFRLPDLPKFCCELRSARGMLRGYTTWTPHPPRKKILKNMPWLLLIQILLPKCEGLFYFLSKEKEIHLTMQFYSSPHCPQKIIDAYIKGLNGWQAAWATRTYNGHWVLPNSLMDNLKGKICYFFPYPL